MADSQLSDLLITHHPGRREATSFRSSAGGNSCAKQKCQQQYNQNLFHDFILILFKNNPQEIAGIRSNVSGRLEEVTN